MTTLETPAPITAPPVTRSDVLHRAADLLEEYGWCQGRTGSKEEGELCLVGAVRTAGDDLDFLVMGFSDWLGFPPAAEPAAWNDEPGRTKAQVVARLRAAAESE